MAILQGSARFSGAGVITSAARWVDVITSGEGFAGGGQSFTRTNLFFQSNNFTGFSPWNPDDVIVTPNATTDPQGGNNASLLAEGTAVNNEHYLDQIATGLIPGATYTRSIYVKAGPGKNFVSLRVFSNPNTGNWVWYRLNLTTGFIDKEGVSGPVTSLAEVTPLPNGWWRFSVSFNLNNLDASAFIRVSLLQGDGSTDVNVYTGDGVSGVYIFGAQLELGTVATTYIPTGAIPVSMTDGSSFAANANRFTFASASFVGGVLNRTNYLLQSNGFDQTFAVAWAGSANFSVTPNQSISPDGLNDAWLWQRTTTALAYSQQVINKPAVPQTFTFSIFANVGNCRYLAFFIDDSTGAEANLITFDMLLGTVALGPIINDTGIGPFSNFSPSVQPAANGFSRYVCSFTTNVGAQLRVIFSARTSLGTLLDTDSALSSAFVFGAQLEMGTVATDYIPTTSNQITASAGFLADSVSYRALLQGAGAFTAKTIQYAAVQPLFAGAGSFKAATFDRVAAFVNLSGQSSLIVDTKVRTVWKGGAAPERATMSAAELNEAVAIAQKILIALMGAAGTKSGLAGSTMTSTIIGAQFIAGESIEDGVFAPTFLSCFEKVRQANATYESMEVVRKLCASFTPRFPTGKWLAFLGEKFSLTEQAQILANKTFDSREVIDGYIDLVNSSFSSAEDQAADLLDNVSYRALIETHGAIINDLTTRERPLPRMIKFVFPRPMPSLWIAQRIYADASKNSELIDENLPIHPLFMGPSIVGLAP